MIIEDDTNHRTVPSLLSQAEMTGELRALVFSTLARGSLVELRSIIDQCEDIPTARNIYTELRQLSYRVARKHNFASAA